MCVFMYMREREREREREGGGGGGDKRENYKHQDHIQYWCIPVSALVSCLQLLTLL